jgi:hypothetical protein
MTPATSVERMHISHNAAGGICQQREELLTALAPAAAVWKYLSLVTIGEPG